jgi:hypothetical protein
VVICLGDNTHIDDEVQWYGSRAAVAHTSPLFVASVLRLGVMRGDHRLITYVQYWYRSPRPSEDVQIVQIAIDRWPDKTPQDILPLIGSVGHLTKVTPDDKDEHGDTREYKVLDISQPEPLIINALTVLVTDPD